ncbi:MAG: hypothetical protein ACRECP_05165 [Methylocella sp.]
MRRSGRDMFDAELLKRPADLCQLRAVDLAARCRRVKIMRAPIRIEVQGQAMRAKHLDQRPEGRGRAFLLDQKRRINLAGGIVQRDNQIERRRARQPDVL